jgi:hypothetical protein
MSSCSGNGEDPTLKDPLPWRLARWVFALFYLGTGLQILAVGAGWLPMPDLHHTPAGAAFHRAMTATGFLDPAIALSYIIAGTCMLFLRTAPLGLVLLAPLMVVIFLFNLLLSPTWVWGSANLLWLLTLAWHVRSAFTPLWRYRLGR